MCTSRTIAATAALLAVSVLTGCSTGAASPAGPATPVDDRMCAALAAQQAPPAAPALFLVVDNTASGIETEMAPAVTETIGTAQRAGAALTVLAVDGRDAPPREVVSRVPLDPAPGRASLSAQSARNAVPGCVATWAASPDASPTVAGSDVLTAVNAGLRQRPRWLVVSGDGMANAGGLDLGRVGLDAEPGDVVDEIADQIAGAGPGTAVVWSGMGETVPSLPESARTGEAAIWTAVLQRAGITNLRIDPGLGARVESPRRAPGPPDGMPVPSGVQGRLDGTGGERFDVPSALLFPPGSAELTADTGPVLAPLVEALAASGSAEVVGHTAAYGPPEYRQSLSLARAERVRAALLTAVPGAAVTASGVGSSDPAVSEWDGGRHDLDAARSNRRVVVTVRPDAGPGGVRDTDGAGAVR